MKLVQHWRLWYRRQSTWLAGLFAAASAAFFANPGMLLGLVNFVPRDLRGFAAGVVFMLCFGIPILVNHISQPKLAEKRKELDNG